MMYNDSWLDLIEFGIIFMLTGYIILRRKDD